MGVIYTLCAWSVTPSCCLHQAAPACIGGHTLGACKVRHQSKVPPLRDSPRSSCWSIACSELERFSLKWNFSYPLATSGDRASERAPKDQVHCSNLESCLCRSMAWPPTWVPMALRAATEFCHLDVLMPQSEIGAARRTSPRISRIKMRCARLGTADFNPSPRN